MHDIKWIEQNPSLFDESMKKRGVKTSAEDIISLNKKRCSIIQNLDKRRHELKEISKRIADIKSGVGVHIDTTNYQMQASVIKDAIPVLAEARKSIEKEIDDIMLNLPNTLLHDVPSGIDENDNVKLSSWGSINTNLNAKQHTHLVDDGHLMNFFDAGLISGSRFVVLQDDLAKLERILTNYMMEHACEHGFRETSTPVIVNEKALKETGQLPKFKDDVYQLDDGKYLIPTGEVTLTNLVRDRIMDGNDLPIRVCAHTQCFRKEAGSAGKDTHGMMRMHQFSKVELVSIVEPDQSSLELEKITSTAQSLLERLELPYQSVLLCAGDTGFSSQKTIDLEVWMPGQQRYREISSCSNMGDFQSRRMKARFKGTQAEKITHVHTLNGSCLAVGRCLIAILENYQLPNGRVKIPDVLIDAMGKDVI